MVDVGAAALGREVRRLREAAGLSQEELGAMADYGSGAGVSISRFENGQMLPRRPRLASIAAALGLTIEELERRASDTIERGASTLKPSGPSPSRKAERTKDRVARIQQEIDARAAVIRDLVDSYAAACARADEEFSGRYATLSSLIGELPDELLPPQAEGADRRIAAERAIELLAPLGSDQDSAEQNQPPADPRLKTVAAVISNAVMTAGMSTRARAGAGTFAVSLVAATAAYLTAGGLILMATRNKEQQRMLLANLDRAEDELARLGPGVEALKTALPRAIEVLSYVSVHGGHAIRRYESQLVHQPESRVVSWPAMSELERRRLVDFSDIAIAQAALSSIDLEAFLSTRDAAELTDRLAQTEQLVARCRAAVEARV
jgi:transcriptional regulator with XRE-family HTH domain